jgi:uncharacterized protein
LKPSVSVVVADAGPLIALSRVTDLSVLRAVFTRALVTRTVLDECLARPDRPEGAHIQAAVDAGWLELVADAESAADWGLDAGETSAIAVARTLGAGLLLDDRAARRVASALGIPMIGVLGFLVLAKRAGAIAEVGPLTSRLVESGYFVTAQVIDEALRLAGE